MSHLLTPHQSLRSLFENNINVNHISEEMKSCNIHEPAAKAKDILDQYEFDCLGIEENGKIIGYVLKDDLKEGICKSYVNVFNSGELVSETTSLIQTLFLLKEKKRVFVLEGNRVTKLVTYSDLQKAPVQLLLFGLVSLVEMNLLKIIKRKLPNNYWKQYLKENRIRHAEELFTKRKALSEELELCDCLQLCDKREIILADEILFRLLELESKNQSKKYFKRLEDLRNNLAHAQEFMKNFTFDEIITLVEQTEIFLRRSEEILIS